MTACTTHCCVLSAMGVTQHYSVNGIIHTWEMKNLPGQIVGKAVAYSPRQNGSFDIQTLFADPNPRYHGLGGLLLQAVLDVLFHNFGSPVYLYVGAADATARAMCLEYGGRFVEGGSNDILHRYEFHSEEHARKAA